MAQLVRAWDSKPKSRGFEAPGTAMPSCGDWFTDPYNEKLTGRDGYGLE